MFADSAYGGFLQDWACDTFDWALEIVTKPAEQKGFGVQPKLWIVERTIAWLVTVMYKMCLTVPVVVRLAGTWSAEGATFLSDAQITHCATMQAAAASITALANQAA